jgi:hypothetical protein
MKFVLVLFLTVAAHAQQLTPSQHFALAKTAVAECLRVTDSVASTKTLDEANRIIADGAPVCHAAHDHFAAIQPESVVYADSQPFRAKANRDLSVAEERWKDQMKVWVANLEEQGWVCRQDGQAWVCKENRLTN